LKYRDGNGFPENKVEAMKYIKLAADAENTQVKTLFENLSKRMN
jgi:hypothetical protein